MTFPTEAEAREFLATLPPPATDAVVIPTTHEHWVITGKTISEQPPKVCSICGESFREFPCNAQPINDGNCCAYCDDHAVTPARITISRHRRGL